MLVTLCKIKGKTKTNLQSGPSMLTLKRQRKENHFKISNKKKILGDLEPMGGKKNIPEILIMVVIISTYWVLVG